jgi:rod shape-determining protein MreD
MGPIFAGVAALIAAMLELTVAARIHVGDAYPQIVLVVAVLLTLVVGFEEGMAWAFVGGLFIDLLAFHPLGTTVFSLLAVVGLAESVSPVLERIRVGRPIIGVVVFTPVFITLTTVTVGLLRPPAPALRFSYVFAAIAANALAAALIAPFLGAARSRVGARARLHWS